MRASLKQNATQNTAQRASSSPSLNVWDETQEEYEERLTQAFSSWLCDLQDANYTFEVL